MRLMRPMRPMNDHLSGGQRSEFKQQNKKLNIKVFIFIRQKLAHLFYDKESWLFFLVEEVYDGHPHVVEVHGLRLNDESCSFGAQI